MWIFAYGSLLYRPAFEALERRPAWLPGYARRLWQGSPDHRGVPEAPGRVATLVPVASEVCAGAAYRVDRAEADAILAALDHREKAGFVRRELPVLDGPGGRAFATAVVYVADEANPHFLGPADARSIAAWVRARRGPSGSNAEYVLRLHEALVALGIVDDHVAEVVAWLGRDGEANSRP